MSEVVGLIGVYNAHGGVRGELTYAVGKLLGRSHCALCDITHATVRRKPAWDAMVARLGVPFDLVHRDEMSSDVATAAQSSGTPMVVARLPDGRLEILLAPGDLEVGGEVGAFETALRDSVHRRGLRLQETTT
jgi:hypothetical protein